MEIKGLSPLEANAPVALELVVETVSVKADGGEFVGRELGLVVADVEERVLAPYIPQVLVILDIGLGLGFLCDDVVEGCHSGGVTALHSVAGEYTGKGKQRE
jgi:hypothetical protein